MEFLLVAYGILQVALFIRPDVPNPQLYHNSVTTCLRTAFLFLIDAYLLYYVASRTCSDRRRLNDALTTFLIACVIMAPLGIFEGLKHWALYDGLKYSLNAYIEQQYNFRGGSLRAVVSAGHSLALGYLLAIAIGCWLHLRQYEVRSWVRLVVPIALVMGLVFAYSRGPWAGAVVIFLAFASLGRAMGKSGFLKMLIVTGIVGAAILASPLGNRIVSVIPYVGKPQSLANVNYRERLAQRSMDMIEAHPLFGDQDAYTELNDLRQGQGIIDFVNTYAYVAVFYGLVGLFCFAGFMLIALVRIYRTIKVVRDDQELAHLGSSLAATIIGTLVMLASCSFVYGYSQMFYLLAGLGAAYVRLAQTQAARSPLSATIRRTAQA
jgi:O-antigen ligase